MRKLSNPLSAKRLPQQALRKVKEHPEKPVELPEVALAAVASYKKQKEVSDFINFMLDAIKRNFNWLNNVVCRQNDFRCALLVGAGPNRFQLQEIIYPSDNDNDIKLEVEMKDSEDHDKIAIAALLRLSNSEIDSLLKYIKTRMVENHLLEEDLQKGKALGVSFAMLRPFSEKQYRVMERIVIGPPKNSTQKRRQEDRIIYSPPIKKTRRVS